MKKIYFLVLMLASIGTSLSTQCAHNKSRRTAQAGRSIQTRIIGRPDGKRTEGTFWLLAGVGAFGAGFAGGMLAAGSVFCGAFLYATAFGYAPLWVAYPEVFEFCLRFSMLVGTTCGMNIFGRLIGDREMEFLKPNFVYIP